MTSPRTDSPTARPQIGVWVAAVVFGLVVASVVAVLYGRYGAGDAVPRVLSFVVEDDSTVRVQFDVAKDPALEAVCLVRARSSSGAEVGHADVRVPVQTEGRKRTVVTQVLTTTDRPVSGEVPRCMILEPGAPLPTHAPSEEAGAPSPPS